MCVCCCCVCVRRGVWAHMEDVNGEQGPERHDHKDDQDWATVCQREDLRVVPPDLLCQHLPRRRLLGRLDLGQGVSTLIVWVGHPLVLQHLLEDRRRCASLIIVIQRVLDGLVRLLGRLDLRRVPKEAAACAPASGVKHHGAAPLPVRKRRTGNARLDQVDRGSPRTRAIGRVPCVNSRGGFTPIPRWRGRRVPRPGPRRSKPRQPLSGAAQGPLPDECPTQR